MYVRELKNRVRLMPKECVVQTNVPGMPTGQPAVPGQFLLPHSPKLYPICKAHHHGLDEERVDDQQPLELFTYGEDEPMTVGELADRLNKFPDGSLVRVAVPQDGHHRVLDIVTVGFGGDPSGDETPTCELTTEFWQSQAPTIRVDNPNIQQGDGDWTYAQEGPVQRHPDTGEITAMPQGEVKRFNVRGHPDGNFDVGKEGESLNRLTTASRKK